MENYQNDVVDKSLNIINNLDNSNLILYTTTPATILTYKVKGIDTVLSKPILCGNKKEDLLLDIKNKVIVIYYAYELDEKIKFAYTIRNYDENNTYLYNDVTLINETRYYI